MVRLRLREPPWNLTVPGTHVCVLGFQYPCDKIGIRGAEGLLPHPHPPFFVTLRVLFRAIYKITRK